MQYVKFGNTGMDVSRICLGMMSFGTPGSENGVFPWARDFEDAKPIFKRAVEFRVHYGNILLFAEHIAERETDKCDIFLFDEFLYILNG